MFARKAIMLMELEKSNPTMEEDVGGYMQMHEIKKKWFLDHHILRCNIC